MFYRLFTTTKEDGIGSIFHLSHKNSIFQKIYCNNMNDDSYKGWNSVSSIIGQPNTALFHSRSTGHKSLLYKTCQVSFFY